MERTVRKFRRLLVLVLWLAAGRAMADGANDHYTVAAGHYAEQRWELAAESFAEFLRLYPEHRQAGQGRFFQGETLVQLGRFDEARATFRQLRDRDPKGPFARQALFRCGEAAYLDGNLDAAKVELQQFHEQYPGDELGAYVVPYLGEIALSEGDTAGAELFFSKAIKEYPQGPLEQDCRLGLARVLAKQGRLDEAEVTFQKMAEDEQNELADRAQFESGLMHYRAGKYDQALSSWELFDARFPKSRLQSRVDLGRGWALFRLKRYDEARERLATIADDPSVAVEARYWLGLTLSADGQWRAAGETLVKAAAAADGQHRLLPAIHFHAGDNLLRAGDLRDAVEQFDLVLEDSPQSKWADDSLFGKLRAALENADHEMVERLAAQLAEQFPDSPFKAESRLLQATSLIALHKDADAIAALQRHLAEDPKDPESLRVKVQLAICYTRLKRIDEARRSYEEFVSECDNEEVVLPAKHQLAEAAYEIGEHGWASELFRTLAEPGNPSEYLALGLSGQAWCLLKAEDLEGSAALFERLLEEHPKSPLAAEAALTRGQILEQQQKLDPALTCYQRVIDQFASSNEVPEALFRAAGLHDKLQQNEQAAKLYAQLISEHPKSVHVDAAIYARAWVLRELGMGDESRGQFERLHRDYPQSKYWADATYRLAEEASEDGHYDRAAEMLASLIQGHAEPGVLAHALYLQGRLASRRELWSEVEPPMARLVRDIPQSPLRLAAEYWIAEAAFRREEYDRAGGLLEKLSGQIEGRKEAWMAMILLRRAQVLAHQNEWGLALQVAERIAAGFPEFPQQHEADYLIGRGLSAQGEMNRAREAYRRVIHSPSGDKTETAAMAQWMIGESYFHQKDYQEALREYLRTEILYGYPKWQAGALLQAGKCHELLAQWSEAVELYGRLLEKYPDTPFTEEAKRRLHVAKKHQTTSPAIR